MAGRYSHQLYLYLFCVAAIVLTSLLIIDPVPSPCPVDAQSSATERFYGSVYNSDALVSCGYVVTATIGANRVGQTTTDAKGRYGYNPVFVIPGKDGQIVNFSINGHPTIEKAVFQGGLSKKLNLTAFGAASYIPTSSCASCSSCTGSACSTSSWGITPTVLPYATAGSPYVVELAASGGSKPYTWSISAGNLPPGLKIDKSLGIIQGKPTTPRLYTFTVQALDSESNCITLSTCILVLASEAESEGTQVIMRAAAVTSNFLGNTDVISLSGNTLTVDKFLESEDRSIRLDLVSGTALYLAGRNTISVSKETNPPAANDGSVCVRSYSFTPAGASFIPAATMTLKYDTPLPGGLDEDGLYLAFWDGSAWIRLQSTVDTAEKEVSAPVSHFTIFAIRGLPGGKENYGVQGNAEEDTSGGDTRSLIYSDLEINPQIARPGEEVKVSVRVVNGSAKAITGDVILEINWVDQIHRQLTIEGGGSQIVDFILTREKPGKYTVSVGQLSSAFSVGAEKTQQRAQRIPADIIIVIICLAGLLIAIILLRDIFRHRRKHVK